MRIAMLSLINAHNGLGFMVNLNNVVAIYEQPTGECVIELSCADETGGNMRITVTSTYPELGAMIYEINRSA